jgi:hypothetical protein
MRQSARLAPASQRLGLVILAAAVALALAACGGSGKAAEDAGPPRPVVTTDSADGAGEAPARPRRRARERSAARVEILEPSDGEVVHTGAVTVSVSVTGFRVVSQRTRPPFPRPLPGRGHIHFYLDTRKLPATHSPPATGSYRSLSLRTHTWTGLLPGRHSLAVQLVGRDHAPLRPQVKDRLTVVVE